MLRGMTTDELDCARHAGGGRAEMIWATLAGEGQVCLFYCGRGAHYVEVSGHSADLLLLWLGYATHAQ